MKVKWLYLKPLKEFYFQIGQIIKVLVPPFKEWLDKFLKIVQKKNVV